MSTISASACRARADSNAPTAAEGTLTWMRQENKAYRDSMKNQHWGRATDCHFEGNRDEVSKMQGHTRNTRRLWGQSSA